MSIHSYPLSGWSEKQSSYQHLIIISLISMIFSFITFFFNIL